MTVDINDYETKKASDIKTCETCKCLTCQSGKLCISNVSCPYGVNCSMCNGKKPLSECTYYKSSF